MTEATPLRVLDYSTHLSGPMTSRILAHLGADVVKIEHPTRGDGNRGSEPLAHGESALHLALNARKRTGPYDRKAPEWPEIFRASAQWAGIVIIGGTPDEVGRRGL